MPLNKQEEILLYLSTVEQATIADIYEHVSFSYYHNWKKYTGEILARMAKTGKVCRVKKGVYKIHRAKLLDNQTKLIL
jgi:predicted transcriptional regulator of viral defense system